ncbi:MAG: T9SS C-terminal target domain-containing protein [Ignavibacteriae bacterium]|nr:MAG: T9SS C-terminal target domain-containing protein [Ignavibacteriota bacterium]
MNTKIKLEVLLIFLLFIGSSVYPQNNFNVHIKVFSSENGYPLTPDNLFIATKDNRDNSLSYKINSNTLSLSFRQGEYSLSIIKKGYSSCETYFILDKNDISYDIFLDPVDKDPLLSSNRIKQIVNDKSTLLLGYVVDKVTGNPLNSVVIKDVKTNLSAVTNSKGYFELFLPSACDIKCKADIRFEKPGYTTEEYNDFEITPGTDFIFTVRLRNGSTIHNNKKDDINNCTECTNPANPYSPFVNSGFVLPVNIRVGRNCTGTSCTYAEVFTVETYCKYVLPAEIYSCWGNLTGGMNSLQACAVAVRTYGVYYVYNPINPSLYDICDNTYCQYLGSVTSTNTNNAVNNTYRYILTNNNGVVRSEYSAENNNKGCGNGYSGTGSAWPCIYDPVCMNKTPNGHGRGLCQWGTVRWATGTFVTASSPCSMGASHTFGIKNWTEILTHYYSVSPFNWSITQGTTATVNSSSAVPSTANPCSTFTVTYNVTANNSAPLMLGASIAPTGTTNWISNPPHDIKLTINQGTGNYNRLFTIPCSAQPGTYDLLTALWYDNNNNNQIDGPDFVVSSKLTEGALVITNQSIGISTISNKIPEVYSLKQNYPNPFNPVTKIDFDIPENTLINITIYDVNGKEVQKVYNDHINAGSYEYIWDASVFPSGLYLCRIESENYNSTIKLVLIK